jgi:hypothetical protein
LVALLIFVLVLGFWWWFITSIQDIKNRRGCGLGKSSG